MGLEDVFKQTLGAYVDVSKARYAVKSENPTAVQIAGAQDGSMPVNSGGVRTPAAASPGVMDRLKNGDGVAWALLIGGTLAAAVIAYRVVR